MEAGAVSPKEERDREVRNNNNNSKHPLTSFIADPDVGGSHLSCISMHAGDCDGDPVSCSLREDGGAGQGDGTF